MYREFEEYIFNNYDIKKVGINRKYYHSKRVAILSKKIAENLGLNLHDVKLATTIGLLHDIARFYEYDLFGKFNSKHFDHGKYGVKLLKEDDYITKYNINEEDYDNVYAAIFYHNKYTISKKYTNNIFCKIIRDADKVDIMYLVSIHQNMINNDLENYGISPKVYKEFIKGKCIKEKHIKTKGDKILNILSFIYDINYTYSLKIINENNYINEMFINLGSPENLKPYFEIINRQIKNRIEKEER